jgi:hypothetical protein
MVPPALCADREDERDGVSAMGDGPAEWYKAWQEGWSYAKVKSNKRVFAFCADDTRKAEAAHGNICSKIAPVLTHRMRLRYAEHPLSASTNTLSRQYPLSCCSPLVL